MFTGKHFGPAKSDVNAGAHSTTINGVQVDYYFSPREALMSQLLAHVDAAKSSIRYLVFTFTKPDLRDHLIARHKAGVKVFGVFDQLQAQGVDSQDDALAAAAVPTYIDGNNHAFGAGNMHHKVMIIDGETGSDPLVV